MSTVRLYKSSPNLSLYKTSLTAPLDKISQLFHYFKKKPPTVHLCIYFKTQYSIALLRTNDCSITTLKNNAKTVLLHTYRKLAVLIFIFTATFSDHLVTFLLKTSLTVLCIFTEQKLIVRFIMCRTIVWLFHCVSMEKL